MENGYIDVTSIEEQQEYAENEHQNTSSHLNGGPSDVPKLTREVAIDRILDERGKKGATEHQYLVKWKSVKQCWVNADELKKFPSLTDAFKKRGSILNFEEEEFDEIISNGTSKRDNSPYTDHDYAGTRQLATAKGATGKRQRQKGGGGTAKEPKKKTTLVNGTDSLVRSSTRPHRPTKRFVEETNESFIRGTSKVRRTSPRKHGKKSTAEGGSEGEESEDDGKEYSVEKVLKKRVKGGKMEYFVKWAGYDDGWNTWEPRESLKHLEVFKQYEKAQQKTVEKNKLEAEETEEDEEEEDEDNEYKVEKVLDRREKDGRVKYKIKWMGYDDSWNSWEPSKSVKHLDVVKQYEKEWKQQHQQEKQHPVSAKRSLRLSRTEQTPTSKGTTPSSSVSVSTKRIRVVVRKEQDDGQAHVEQTEMDAVSVETKDLAPKTPSKKKKKRSRY
ncbi:hypothetical protein niasHT_016793 [Heterodera trifolii]|uniref:Chromo domain-containing protein n=1 Tax=Heterodera trifolii TaxID=157864 RepID=A0ABD2LER4_9BILA